MSKSDYQFLIRRTKATDRLDALVMEVFNDRSLDVETRLELAGDIGRRFNELSGVARPPQFRWDMPAERGLSQSAAGGQAETRAGTSPAPVPGAALRVETTRAPRKTMADVVVMCAELPDSETPGQAVIDRRYSNRQS